MASYTYAILLHDTNGLIVKQIVVKTPAIIDRIDFSMIGHNHVMYPMQMSMPHPTHRHPLTAMLYNAPQSPPVSVEHVEEPQLKEPEDVIDIPEQESAASSSEPEKKKCWSNYIVKPALLEKEDKYNDTQESDDDFDCFSKNYPPESGALFAFNVPREVIDSGSWIVGFLKIVKMEMIRIRVNVNVIDMILKTVWYNQRKRARSGVDYTDENKWFAPLYRFIKHTDGVRKCTRFNRWRADRGDNCDKRYCKFHHMCAVCGNPKHGAFNRNPDGEFMCNDVKELTDQYAALEESGYKPIDLFKELYPILNEIRNNKE
jgi:hypothetical protein